MSSWSKNETGEKERLLIVNMTVMTFPQRMRCFVQSYDLMIYDKNTSGLSVSSSPPVETSLLNVKIATRECPAAL